MGNATLQQRIKTECEFVPYSHTGYFSSIMLDYVSQSPQLRPFYEHLPSKEGVLEVIKQRSSFQVNRQVLVNSLTQQYEGLPLTPALENSLQLLNNENTFTITTAHQPNIFTGPLYFIYKIVHTIKLAAELKQQLPDFDFVPVYYMGSEDADLEELGSITLQGKKYEWKTSQTGAVGRMKVDKAFLSLITEMKGQLGVLPHGEEVIKLFSDHYTAGISIQEATLGVVNALFGEYGLVVLIPDARDLKKLFVPVIRKELESGFSHKAVVPTLEQLGQHYKVQAGGRDINLFYLLDDTRERIETDTAKPGTYFVQSGKSWTLAEILDELEQFPERFSPNVILRGVFQETVLPNVVFIGGGGELAYWLELKQVFAAAGVPYPVLLPRNSFGLIDAVGRTNFAETGLPLHMIFRSMHEQMNEIVRLHSQNQLSLTAELEQVNNLYQSIGEAAAKVDPTLLQHVQALQIQAVKKLEVLQKKLVKAEKRKFGEEKHRLEQVRQKLFPANSLQERVENMASWYALLGKDLLEILLLHSKGWEPEFGIITAG